MRSATVVSAGVARHPQSNKDRMCIMVNLPWASAGERYPATEIWGPIEMPEPQTGDLISWDGGHIEYRGTRYRKPEYDDDPDPSLPAH